MDMDRHSLWLVEQCQYSMEIVLLMVKDMGHGLTRIIPWIYDLRKILVERVASKELYVPLF